MKLKSILIASLALTLGFASCSKEDTASSGRQAVAISIPSEFLTKGIIEDPNAGGTGTTITNMQIFLLNGNSVVEEEYYTAAPVGTTYIEDVSASINKVIVLANIPATDLTAVRALTSETDIQAYAFTTADQQPTALPATAGILGKTLISETKNLTTVSNPIPGHSTTPYKEATVNLKSITARMEIGAVRAGEGIASVNLVGVWVNNYYTTGAKSTAKLHTDIDPMWDVASPAVGVGSAPFADPTTIPAYTDGSFYLAADEAQVELNAASKAYVFHVFGDAKEDLVTPANDAMPHVIMLVKGEYEPGFHEDANDQFFLKWVTFNRYQTAPSVYLTSMDRNQIYKIGVGTTGVLINAKELTEKPEPGKSDFGIAVTVENWAIQNLTPEAM